MANIKSQKKRNLTNENARLRNASYKSQLRTLTRSVEKAIAAGDKDAAQAAVHVANRKLDKAASRGVIHRNQAANRKSGIARKVNAMDA